MIVLIVPWPHYAELMIGDRVGIRFSFPDGRHDATPCELVVVRRGTDPLEVAFAFREWRRGENETGAIPPVRSLTDRAKPLPQVSRVFGAPHFYLWGPLHSELAEAPLIRFEWLSEDHLVQRTTFRRTTGEVTLTANFGEARVHACFSEDSKAVARRS